MTSIIAQFEIPWISILDSNSNLCAPLPEFAKDPKVLIELYEHMLRARLFDKKAVALQRTGKLGTYAPINGQEAVSTAIGHAMQPEDVFVPYYRDYAAQFQRGVRLAEILSYWGGDERGNNYADLRCREDLPICVPIASQCLHAAGVAFAIKYRKQKRVVVACLGDGGSSEGDFYESINVAGVWKLPLVFVVNNNNWAISVPRARQTASQTLAQKAIAAGLNGIVVDGNDILALREVIANAILDARESNTPVLIEAMTYRLCDHTTADDACRYQPEEEVLKAQKNEPIERLKKYLLAQNLWDNTRDEELNMFLTAEINKAAEEYLEKSPQKISSIFDYHYATLPDYLIEQRAIAIEEESYV